MNEKFKTISSSLFNNSNDNNQIPEWMEDLNTDVKQPEPLDIDFDLKGVFAEKTTVNRDNKIGSPRQLKASPSNEQLITEAKIELAKFLSGKYYKVDGSVNGNNVKLNVNIDGVQGNFTFNYYQKNGKLKKSNVFLINDKVEYPFSLAGFYECIDDIKTKKVTASTINQSSKTYIITREEIVRRYNGKLREATDKINSLLKDSKIVGVNSNCYASFYDVDDLFPQLEKEEKMPEKLPEFEFVPNTEHVAASEHKSANLLSIDASKFLSELFKDHFIKQCSRDKNELLIKADILANSGLTHSIDFCFGIKNEKIDSIKIAEINDERLTIEQLLSKINENADALNEYLDKNKHVAKRIYRGIVLTYKEIHRKLFGIINKNKVDNVIARWVKDRLITPVNSTTFTTTASFESLLANINEDILDNNEKENLIKLSKTFGDGYGSERHDVKDTGVREPKQKVTDETLLSSANQFLSKYFNNFKIDNFKIQDEHVNYNVTIFDDELGISSNVSISLTHSENDVIEAKINHNGKQIDLVDAKKMFAKNEILNKYLEKNSGKKSNAPILMTKKKLANKLKNISNISENEIIEILNDWEKSGKIDNIGSDIFASKHTFEELLSLSSINPLSDEEIELNILKSQRDRGKQITANHLKDHENRKLTETWSKERMLIEAKAKLGKVYQSLEVLNATINNDNFVVEANVINSNGIKKKINAKFSLHGTKVNKIDNIDGDNDDDKAVKHFIQQNNGVVNKRQNKIIISKNKLRHDLLSVVSSKNINEVENILVKNKVIVPISINQFVSEFSLPEIIAYLSKKDYTSIKSGLSQQLLAKKDKTIVIDDKRLMDNDTREIKIEKELSPYLVKLSNKIKKEATSAFNKKIITENKLNEITSLLSKAKSHRDLENAWNELRKYFS